MTPIFVIPTSFDNMERLPITQHMFGLLAGRLVASFALTLAAEISSYYYQLQEKSREKKFRREELKLATVVKCSFE
ncbi:hypothetical protein NQ318_005628 [Aromia moschata]|uniref:Uncharacterized protein n=1 Tax=Aromia moschata TaxID=1265417 RepID=A0AAV8XAL3_9CUCU|nr:hypothetical protein NQ318_005628 [Aromia moschata]